MHTEYKRQLIITIWYQLPTFSCVEVSNPGMMLFLCSICIKIDICLRGSSPLESKLFWYGFQCHKETIYLTRCEFMGQVHVLNLILAINFWEHWAWQCTSWCNNSKNRVETIDICKKRNLTLKDNAENAKFGAWNVKHRKPRLEWQDLKLGSKCCTSLSKVQLLTWLYCCCSKN